jgi:hypothetical protein
VSATAKASEDERDDARALALELACSPGRRSRLLDGRQAAELRAAVDALLARAASWRPPPRGPDDGPPAPGRVVAAAATRPR